MSDLENFINSDYAASLPPLVVAAMAHCQFETIHPFPDGNGRVGRILIPLILKDQNVLDEPLLFLSPVIERVKDEYIQRLYDVNRNGEWLQWIEFFLDAVQQTCEKTISTVQKLHDLNLSYLDRVQKARTSALQRGLVNALFEWPVITIPAAADRLDITYPAAKNNMERLAETGIVQELHGSERPRVFFAPEIIALLEEV